MSSTDPIRTNAQAVNPAARVMIVDDEPVNIKVVRRYLQLAGYQHFITLNDPSGAMDLMRREKPDVLLLDVVMPQISGLDILQSLRADADLCHTPTLILTASTDAQTKLTALDRGATDFLAKPVDPNELLPRIRNALLVKAHHDHLTSYSERLEDEVRLRTAELEASRLHIIHCLARAGEHRDDCTGQHVLRVGRYAGLIARGMGQSDAFVRMIELAAQLHDVGKIGIPDAIMLKPGKLDAAEYRLMQEHCTVGCSIIAPALGQGSASDAAAPGSPLLRMAANIASSHHERWDGGGYPLGLMGETIPLEGRITSVADVFDALTSARPYKPAFTSDQSVSMIRQGRGTQFDPAVVDAFLAVFAEITAAQALLSDAAAQVPAAA